MGKGPVRAIVLVLLVPFGLVWGDPQSRRTPIVEAIAKTRDAIVTLKVEKQGSFGKNAETIGTAVVVDERGYALTNRHVIMYAAKVTAVLADGMALNAKVILEDTHRDLAILKLDGKSFTPLVLGPSCDLMVGETIIAIGNPYGYVNTVSRGIISALGREILMPGGERLYDLIQLDAAINPGSSGGPLLNIHGELIGMNVAMREGAQGIAFAIPSDSLKDFLAQALSAKKLSGIDHGLTCTERVAQEGPDRQSVVVSFLDRHGLAATAGVQAGDRIVAVSGRSVVNRFDVERALWDTKPGTPIRFLVERAGRQVDLSLQLPAQPKTAAAEQEPGR
jgi:serine protease Do